MSDQPRSEVDRASQPGSESYSLRASASLRFAFDNLVLPWSLMHGSLTFRLIAQAGRIANSLKVNGPTPSSVRNLFRCSNREAGVIAREMTASYFRNRAVIGFARSKGLKRLSDFVDIEESKAARDLATSQQPAILLTWHLGAMFGIPGAAYRWQRPTLIFRKGPFYAPPPNFRILTTAGKTDEERSLLLFEALQHLANGGLVMVAADGDDGGVISVPCLGRSVVFRRGAFALSRFTGVPLIPTVSRWTRDGRMAVAIHSPISACRTATGCSDSALAVASAQWLETYLLQRPEELWPSGLRSFLNSPTVPPGVNRN